MFGQQSASPYSAFWNSPVTFQDKWGLAPDSIVKSLVPGIAFGVIGDDIPIYSSYRNFNSFYWQSMMNRGSMIDYSSFYGARSNDEGGGGGGNPGSGSNDGIKPRNLFGSYYIGPWNPIDKSGKQTYAPTPRTLLDMFAMSHDINYDKVKAVGAMDAFFNLQTLAADKQLAWQAFSFAGMQRPGTYEAYQGFTVGFFFLGISTYKSLYGEFKNAVR